MDNLFFCLYTTMESWIIYTFVYILKWNHGKFILLSIYYNGSWLIYSFVYILQWMMANLFFCLYTKMESRIIYSFVYMLQWNHG